LQTTSGALAARRQQQALAWMWERIDAGLKQSFRDNPAVRERLPTLSGAVQSGQIAASTAARQLLNACHPGPDPGSLPGTKMVSGSSPG